MNIHDNVPCAVRQLRPKNMPKKTAEMITRLAQAYGLENIGEIDEQFLNGFTCASEIVIAQLEKEFDSDNKGEWIKMGEAYVCSRCSTTCACTETADKLIWHIDDKFCRGCGASMRGE